MRKSKRILSSMLATTSLMAAFSLPAQASEEKSTYTKSFSDVTPDLWYYNYIMDMAELDFVAGTEEDLFNPESTLTYASFCVMLSNAFYGETLAEKMTTSNGQWWLPFVETCLIRKGLTGTAIERFFYDEGFGMFWYDEPSKDLTRYDVAQMVYNLLKERGVYPVAEDKLQEILEIFPEEIPEEYETAVATAYYLGLLSGRPSGSFDGESFLKRGEAAAILSSLVSFSQVSTETLESALSVSVPQFPVEEESTVEAEDKGQDDTAQDDTALTEFKVTAAWSDKEGTGTGSLDYAHEVTVSTILGATSPNAYVIDGDMYVKNLGTQSIEIADLSQAANHEISPDSQGPQILIYHSHATEAFCPVEGTTYNASGYYRSQDTDYNIAAVGAAMAEVFRAAGFEVIHDTTLHDAQDYNASYTNSAVTVSKYLEEYPSIQLIFDVHRDGLERDSKPLQLLSEQNGEDIAQVMLYVASETTKISHPTWRENFALALQIQEDLLQYGDFARPITVSSGRYNQDLSPYNLLLEVGNHGNTLQQALDAGVLFATSVCNSLTGNYSPEISSEEPPEQVEIPEIVPEVVPEAVLPEPEVPSLDEDTSEELEIPEYISSDGVEDGLLDDLEAQG